MVLVLVCSLAGAFGIGLLARAVKAGIAAEALASVGIGLALLLVFREQDLSIFGETLGAEALSGGSTLAGLLAALAVGGWVFIGFDACVAASEETASAARHVPRAIWIALLSVGALVILNAVAVTLAHPDPAAVVAGEDLDPVTTAVVTSFGSWSDKPFAAVVLVAFLACGMAAQALTARSIYSIARDGVLPASRFLRGVDRRGTPIGATITTAAIACLGLLLGLDSTAVGSLIAFGTAAIYVAFLLVALAALVARLRGTWVPAGAVRLGRAGSGREPAGRGLARVRDGEHRLAARVARAAGRTRLPGVGGADGAGRDRGGGARLPGAGEAPPADQRSARGLRTGAPVGGDRHPLGDVGRERSDVVGEVGRAAGPLSEGCAIGVGHGCDPAPIGPCDHRGGTLSRHPEPPTVRKSCLRLTRAGITV